VKDSREQSDSALVGRILGGDADAFALLVDRYKGIVWSIACNASGSLHDAEDLAQEAFVRAYLDLGSLRDPSRFRSWLYKVTVNVCRTWHRMARRRPLRMDVDCDSLPRQNAPTGRWAGMSNYELRSRVMAAVNSLPPKTRAPVMLYYVDGLSQKEVADLLHISVGAVKSRLHRARKDLREGARELVERRLRDCEPDRAFTRQLQELLRDLGDADPRVRTRAARALEKAQDAGTSEALARALEDEAPVVRMIAARTLGNLGDPKAISVLTGVLTKDTDRRVQVEAVRALGRLRAARALPQMRTCLGSEHVDVRAWAAAAIAAIGDMESLPLLADALLQEMERLRGKQQNAMAAWFISSAIAQLGGSSVLPQLLPLLRGDAHSQWVGAGIFAQLADSDQFVPDLVRIVKNCGMGWDRAAQALARIGDPTGVPAIEEAIRVCKYRRYGASAFVAAEALCLLGEQGAAAASRLLGDADPAVRKAAAHGLAVHGGADSIPALESAAEDENPGVRLEAKKGLLRLKRGKPDVARPNYRPQCDAPTL
jgi:RNA polymerase sigma-70 factor (ECF subfamily)